ncbi:Uncharacterised protein [Enterobacter asburiae]|uniref:Uncharacterized protein n=1 Tax=Enterobacter asburiae TaxID=61645 RepID=A0A376FLD2_ENTAS|nr:Uncharacterised protein [Enterobacter asburiae]
MRGVVVALACSLISIAGSLEPNLMRFILQQRLLCDRFPPFARRASLIIPRHNTNNTPQSCTEFTMNNVLGFLEAKTDAAGGQNGPAASSWGHSRRLRVIHAVYHRRLYSAGESRRSQIKPISSLCLRPLARAGAPLSKSRSTRCSPPCRCSSASWSPSAWRNTTVKTASPAASWRWLPFSS